MEDSHFDEHIFQMGWFNHQPHHIEKTVWKYRSPPILKRLQILLIKLWESWPLDDIHTSVSWKAFCPFPMTDPWDPYIYLHEHHQNQPQFHVGKKYRSSLWIRHVFPFFHVQVLRIGKLVRSIRMIRMTRVMVSLQMLIKCLLGSANTLLWSFSLLAEFPSWFAI